MIRTSSSLNLLLIRSIYKPSSTVRAYSTSPDPKGKSKQEDSSPSPPTPPTEPSFTSSLSKTAAEANLKPLPFLSTPLGVKSPPPKGGKLSWTERRDNYFDPESRGERRKAIVKEATRGYFHDFHGLRSHGGKTWRSAKTLIREEVSLSQSRGEERSQKRLKLEAHGCKPLQKSHKRIVSEVSRRRGGKFRGASAELEDW